MATRASRLKEKFPKVPWHTIPASIFAPAWIGYAESWAAIVTAWDEGEFTTMVPGSPLPLAGLLATIEYVPPPNPPPPPPPPPPPTHATAAARFYYYKSVGGTSLIALLAAATNAATAGRFTHLVAWQCCSWSRKRGEEKQQELIGMTAAAEASPPSTLAIFCPCPCPSPCPSWWLFAICRLIELCYPGTPVGPHVLYLLGSTGHRGDTRGIMRSPQHCLTECPWAHGCMGVVYIY